MAKSAGAPRGGSGWEKSPPELVRWFEEITSGIDRSPKSSGHDFSRAEKRKKEGALAREGVAPATTNSAPLTVEEKDMLVDFAPYLFQGKLCGFLTRLSATGLANVTSGGGQVPAFRVRPRR